MDFIAREKMIDNVCMIIQGALNNKAPKELEEKIHPLGVFEGMKVIMSESFDVQGGFDDVYRIFLVDTPIGAYFEEYLKEADRDKDDMARAGIETSQVGGILTKQDLEIMKTSSLVEPLNHTAGGWLRWKSSLKHLCNWVRLNVYVPIQSRQSRRCQKLFRFDQVWCHDELW